MELRQGSRVQPGTWGRGYSTSTRVYWFTPSQEFGMDETQVNEGAPRETEREPRTSDSILLERLRTRRDRTYDRILTSDDTASTSTLPLPNPFPVLYGFQSSWEELKKDCSASIQLKMPRKQAPDEDERDD